MMDSGAGKDDGGILFTAESPSCLRHIVGDDQIKTFAVSLVGRMPDEMLCLRGKSDQDLGGRLAESIARISGARSSSSGGMAAVPFFSFCDAGAMGRKSATPQP